MGTFFGAQVFSILLTVKPKCVVLLFGMIQILILDVVLVTLTNLILKNVTKNILILKRVLKNLAQLFWVNILISPKSRTIFRVNWLRKLSLCEKSGMMDIF